MFRINIRTTTVACEDLKRAGTQLSDLISEFNDSVRTVSGMKGMEDVVGVLRDCQIEMEDEEQEIKMCSSSMDRINESYGRCEDQVINNADGAYVKYKYYTTGIIGTPEMSKNADNLINNFVL